MSKSNKAKQLQKWMNKPKFDPIAEGWEGLGDGVYTKKVDGSQMTYDSVRCKVEWRGKTWHGIGNSDIGNFIKNRNGHADHTETERSVSV